MEICIVSTTLFGFQITPPEDPQKKEEKQKSFALPQNDDGAVVIQSGAYYGTYVDLDGAVRNEIELITRYREMAMQPELENAIDQITNEAIVMDDTGHAVEINTDDCVNMTPQIRQRVNEEFNYVLKLLNFGNMGNQVFKRWYIDGRLFYHIIIDETRPADGIKEIRYIDPRRIRKIREIQKTRDPKTGMEIIKNTNEYYLYNERGVIGAHSNLGAKISADSVVNVNSGLMDPKRIMVLSYLHKAIKPLNNLRMMEDSTVIYRMSRAPERRIFYIDVGNMPTIKAEQYLRDIMVKYRNKLGYDSRTGEIKDDRKHLSMLEDFWLPRREGSKGTEIETLKGGENLGVMEDVKYFEQKLYKALGIPISRLEQNQGFSLGRTTEITRDELNFMKFIMRIRNEFSHIFDDLLRIQLVLKRVCTEEDWKTWKEEIWYDFKKDNNFNELKESELLTNRFQVLAMADPYVGKYFSIAWVRKNILQFSDEEIAQMDQQMADEQQAMMQQQIQQGQNFDQNGQPLPLDQNGMPIQPGQPPALPGQQQQQALPPPSKDKKANGKENPLASKRGSRFINDTLEAVR